MRAVILVLCFVISIGCKDARYMKEQASLTEGRLTIAIDKSYRPLLEETISVFERLHEKADIRPTYAEEEEVTRMFLSDSCTLAVVSRMLTDQELQQLVKQGEAVRQVWYASDGLAFVVHKQAEDTILTLEALERFLAGTSSEPATTPSTDQPRVIVGGSRSSIVRYLEEQILRGQPFAQQVFAVDDIETLLQYVEQSRQTMGVLSSSWISNRGDSLSESILRRVRVISLVDSAENVCQPIRPHLLTGCYPLQRKIYLLVRERGVGIGMGFASFLMSQEGQLIVHRFGLLAAKQPVRIIEVKREF